MITPFAIEFAIWAILSVAGIIFSLWLLCPKGPTMEQIVAQRGPLHVFPELRLPKSFMKEPKEDQHWPFWVEAGARVLALIVLVGIVGMGIDSHRKDDCDY